MSPRARSAATKFVVMTLLWIVLQKVSDLVSWGHRESVTELLITAPLFGAVMAVFEWFGWERRRRRELESSSVS